MTMKKSFKKWIDALESGKYRKTTGTLHRVENKKSEYCCLGVACDLYQKEVGDLEKSSDSCDPSIKEYDEEQSVLPIKVQKWLGLSTNNGRYSHDQNLIQLNDEFGYSFKEIAKVLKKNYTSLRNYGKTQESSSSEC